MDRLNSEAFAEAAAPNSRDAFLCYCHGVTHDDFRQGVWQSPDTPFTEITAQLKVGTKCTACLLNAENLYHTARRDRPSDFVGTSTTMARKTGWTRQTVYAWMDSLTPNVGIVTNEVVPVFAGPGVSTTMTIANSVSDALGAKSAPFKGRIRVFDGGGRLLGMQPYAIAPGARADIRVSDMLPSTGDAGGYALGSCWVDRKPSGPGYRGTIRGHFVVRTARATTAVHAQEAQRSGSRSFMTSRLNPTEEQFVSVVNCGNRDSEVMIRVALLRGGVDEELRAEIPRYSSRLLTLPQLNKGTDDHVHVVTISSSQRSRYHLMIRDGQRLSLDHV